MPRTHVPILQYPVPVLQFADKRGLEEDTFATFRLHRTWAQKLEPGEVVFLSHENQILNHGFVKTATWGRVSEILPQHAAYSHIEMAMLRELGGHYDPSAAPARRYESLTRTYGPARINPHSFISVIYISPGKRF